ncbi:SPW repeat protein [Streptomyces sp. NBC_01387]|uniref:SPW repeat protein n=1 Tax=unclassified Streptomyces TaxID=2593676 RepID=UPI002025784D|nr:MULTISPECIES: SPW repeat protein [unclassified Streptomyces]MCX4553878.1 SPW repeat protein [Streptomyces sp. NBC_01500]WSC18789.1 SPW repeat protein [Streptomyces sp. NBC_01766]WSV52824.1 SPW repeat protein [Streptomyces sp. NBC_01014]
MADVSHKADVSQKARGDLGSHPDVPEMQARYARVLGGRDVAFADGPVFLVGLYCAVSPWVLHFNTTQPALTPVNIIMGIAIGLLAVGFAAAPQRMYGLSWAMCAMGAWLIAAPWVAGSGPDRGVIWNNAVIGGLTILLGLICAGVSARSRRHRV